MITQQMVDAKRKRQAARDELAKLRAENERLREACAELVRLHEQWQGYESGCDCPDCMAIQAGRDALEAE